MDKLLCPYCQKSFAPMEMLFYADPQEGQKFVTRIGKTDAEQNISATGGMQAPRKATNFESMRKKSSRSLRGNAEAETEAEESREEDGRAADSDFPLGVSIEDTIAKQALARFGESVTFRFKRTARFYAICESEEEAENKPGYGYVIEWEDGEQTIPRRLNVPTRTMNPKLSHRICPRCHCDIPGRYFTTPTSRMHVAALAGTTASGKTQFITVALADLLTKQWGNLFPDGRKIQLTECSKWFHDVYLEDWRDDGTVEATQKIPLFPLMLEVEDEQQRTHYITFHDCAGEYARDEDYAGNLPGFEQADTMLLMADSAKLFGRKLNDGELIAPDSFLLGLAPMREHPAMVQNLRNIIVVLTKCDAIMSGDNPILSQTAQNTTVRLISYESSLECHKGGLDLSRIETNKGQLLKMMRGYGPEDLDMTILKTINKERPKDQQLTNSNIGLLAVSTYSATPDGLKRIRDVDTAVFHRVTEPLLLAMYNWRIIPGMKKQENSAPNGGAGRPGQGPARPGQPAQRGQAPKSQPPQREPEKKRKGWFFGRR